MVEVKRRISGILALFSVILYATGFEICDFFYPDVKTLDCCTNEMVYTIHNEWRFLRDTLTGVVIFILVGLNFLPKTKLKVASLWALGVFCFGNVVDRLIFNISEFVDSDWVVIALAILIFIYKLKIERNVKTILE